MNFKKYPELVGEKGVHSRGMSALEDALAEGSVQLWQVGQNMPTAEHFLLIRWDVVLTFPRQSNIVFHMGSFHDRKKAEEFKLATLEAQYQVKAERKAKAAADRARTKAIREEIREEMRKVSAMTPEEQGEYWAEKARKDAEQIRKWEEELESFRNKSDE